MPDKCTEVKHFYEWLEKNKIPNFAHTCGDFQHVWLIGCLTLLRDKFFDFQNNFPTEKQAIEKKQKELSWFKAVLTSVLFPKDIKTKEQQVETTISNWQDTDLL